MPLAIIVFIYRRKFKSFTSEGKQVVMALFFAGLFGTFSYMCYSHLPVVDFTEWKTGNKLYPENPQPVKYFLKYKNKQSGEQKEYLSPNYPYNDSIWMAQWEFVSQRVEDPNIYYGKSLIIADTTGNNVTESIIRNPDYQLIVNSYDLSKADREAFLKLNDFSTKAYADNIPTAVLVSSEPSQIARFARDNKLQLDFYTADDIVLKSIVRSNPGLLLMKDGVILKKWHYNDIPDYEDFKKGLGQDK